MKIYSRFGDEGQTQLLGGMVTGKSDIRIMMCGELDEMNAVLGMVVASGLEEVIRARLVDVQARLFDAGAMVAGLGSATRQVGVVPGSVEVATIETEIDAMQSRLPPLKNFILPGGCASGACLHWARTVCRRAERCCARLCRDWPQEQGPRQLLIYLNRLSDWLFVAARLSNRLAGVAETAWMANPSATREEPER